jgi:hypothetical protein
VWHAITEFLLKVRSSGLSHEAVIEIMIGLLGIMVAVLTLIAGLFAAAVSIVGVFGYTTIRDEAVKRAVDTAKKTATTVAKNIARKNLREISERGQASGMTASQAISEEEVVGTTQRSGRRKATTDKALKNS